MPSSSKSGVLVLLVLVLVVLVLFSISRRKKSKAASGESSLALSSSKPKELPFTSTTLHGMQTKTSGFRPVRWVIFQFYMPIQFDTRIKFGKMGIPNSAGLKGCIAPANDQGSCGSSWAYAVSAMVSDRIRIQSSQPAIEGMALRDQNLSTNWLMREGNQCVQLRSLIKGNANFHCDPFASCQLGTPVLALQFIQQRGCIAQNADGYANNRAIDIYKIKEFYTVAIDIAGEMNYYFFPGQRRMRPSAQWAYHEGVVNIQKELSTRGPVCVVFNLYSDLLAQYRYGIKNDDVYIQAEGSRPIVGHVTDHGVKYMGDQAACIVGWGEKYYYSEKIEYWVVRMTWGPTWNGDGFFKIQRGVNCCNMELEVLGTWDYAIESSARGSFADESDVDKVPTLAQPSPMPWAVIGD